ncbi:hypothetical protein GCM10008090_03320 [Arenicella chitinivorans]|uniref:Acetyltransferase n=1 Tax=Arenicella chitinivorans TaxID=1329800 RepID=A0A918RIG4_9GAMM|nr:DHH family phosphoesterase [Arenicella chitinivorans]GGZ98251.1 hypothetical protein GCM10008090_03320 [Arenicella chitinivorans]
MRYVDCFNGDADGICALTQLRLHQPVESELVTGVKRDIKLLERIKVQQGDLVTVLDISLDKNRFELERVLGSGATVFYCDHHFAGEIPDHPKLTTLINTTPDVCTSLLINQQLKGRYLAWAVVGTFGDNLLKSARGLAKPLDLTDAQLNELELLGIYLNYNGYGAGLEDLYFDPAVLAQRTMQFASPFEFMLEDPETFGTLKHGYHSDMNHAAAMTPHHRSAEAEIYILPNEAWARRVSGVFGNDLANRAPDRAHAVLTERSDGQFLVSVRAPLNNKQHADVVCRQFATGGGRAAAAGINQLPASELTQFISVLCETYR